MRVQEEDVFTVVRLQNGEAVLAAMHRRDCAFTVESIALSSIEAPVMVACNGT